MDCAKKIFAIMVAESWNRDDTNYQSPTLKKSSSHNLFPFKENLKMAHSGTFLLCLLMLLYIIMEK